MECAMRRRERRPHAVWFATLVLGALLLGAPAASAETFSQTSAFVYAGTNPCTGEDFSGTGTMHFLSSANLSSGGALMSDLDVRIDGLQALTVFPVAGKKYVVQDTFADRFVFSGASEETFDIVAHFVRVGEDGSFILGDDFYEYMRTHITANANGMVTSFHIDTSQMPCQ